MHLVHNEVHRSALVGPMEGGCNTLFVLFGKPSLPPCRYWQMERHNQIVELVDESGPERKKAG
jgi:hypothetical protein